MKNFKNKAVNSPELQTAREKTLLFSGIECLFWMTMSAQLFLVPFLQKFGLNSIEVGTILALIASMAILAPPIFGIIADKIRSTRKTLMLCLIVGTVLWMILPFIKSGSAGSVIFMAVILLGSMFFIRPMGALLDGWLMQTVNSGKGMEYGKIRVWGSIGYAVMASLLTFVVKNTSVTISFFVFAILAIPTYLLFSSQKDVGGQAVKPLSFREMRPGRLFKNFYFVALMVIVFALGIPMNNGGTFLTYMVIEVKGDTSSLGILVGLRAALEIPFMILSTRLFKRFSPAKAIMIPAVLYMCEQFLYIICANTTQILFVCFISGLANGLFFPCMVNYAASLAPKELNATAQTVIGAMLGVSGIASSILGGWAIGAIGVRAFYAISGIIVLVALVAYALSFRFGEKVMKQPIPDCAKRPVTVNIAE